MRIEQPAAHHEAAFIAAVQRSRRLHRPWVAPPDTRRAFRKYLEQRGRPNQGGYLVWTESGELAGVINLNEIVRGLFQSAYLGYYAFVPHAGHGHMAAGIQKVLRQAFRGLALHRLEANIQPGNQASRALVERAGFRLEGYSPRYLKIAGRWRDHERWALTVEQWRESLASTRRAR